MDWQWRSPRTQRRAVGDVSDSRHVERGTLTIVEVLWQLFFAGVRWNLVAFFSVQGGLVRLGRVCAVCGGPVKFFFLVKVWSAAFSDEYGEKDAALSVVGCSVALVEGVVTGVAQKM